MQKFKTKITTREIGFNMQDTLTELTKYYETINFQKLDVAFKSFNPSDIADLEKSDKIKTVIGQGPYIRYICPVHAREPFNNKVLRQALAAAVNRPDFIKKVFLGQNAPLYSQVPMGMWTHTDNFKEVYGDGNIEKAQELLASQGYTEDNPLEFDLWYTPAH